MCRKTLARNYRRKIKQHQNVPRRPPNADDMLRYLVAEYTRGRFYFCLSESQDMTHFVHIETNDLAGTFRKQNARLAAQRRLV
jgi:hypothetical protein